MKVTAAILSLMPFLAAAAPTATSGSATPTSYTPSSTATATSTPAPVPTVFTIKAFAPNSSEIHDKPIQAAGQNFWIGGNTATYCPTQVGDACPPGDDTVIVGVSSLSTLVPGGQTLYVEPSGALGFTQAHSISIPAGSAISGFSYAPGVYHDYYSFNGWGADGFMACPDDDSWQVFAAMKNATVPSGNVRDCVKFASFAYHYTGPNPAAWQYI